MKDLENYIYTLKKLIDSQAEDENLWFYAEHITEAYLQKNLRELHLAVEDLLDRSEEFKKMNFPKE